MPRYKRYGYTISVEDRTHLNAQGQINVFAAPYIVGFELNEKKAQEAVNFLINSSIRKVGNKLKVVADTSYEYAEQTSGDTLRVVLIDYPGGHSRSQIILQRWFVWVGKE